MNYMHIYTYLCDITDISDFRRLFGGHMHAYAVNAYAVSIKLGNHITLQSPFSYLGVSVAVRNALRSRRPSFEFDGHFDRLAPASQTLLFLLCLPRCSPAPTHRYNIYISKTV